MVLRLGDPYAIFFLAKRGFLNIKKDQKSNDMLLVEGVFPDVGGTIVNRTKIIKYFSEHFSCWKNIYTYGTITENCLYKKTKDYSVTCY